MKIHIIGNDDIILLMRLLRIEGTVVADSKDFLRNFNRIISNTSIEMLIIAIDLPLALIDFIIDFKLNNRKPFVFYLPDIFKANIENEDVIYNKILESIGKIIS
jgi:vacuolar-type H+-ATPase subunit F/Vma7